MLSALGAPGLIAMHFRRRDPTMYIWRWRKGDPVDAAAKISIPAVLPLSSVPHVHHEVLRWALSFSFIRTRSFPSGPDIKKNRSRNSVSPRSRHSTNYRRRISTGGDLTACKTSINLRFMVHISRYKTDEFWRNTGFIYSHYFECHGEF